MHDPTHVHKIMHTSAHTQTSTQSHIHTQPHPILSQQNNRLFLFLSELMDLIVAGRDQSAADQPNYLAEGHPPL
jgi:hypothetical protein